MAADFYDEMAGVATELLTEFKQGEVKLWRKGTAGTPPNEYTPGTPGTPQSWTLNSIAKAASEDKANAKLIEQGTILASDLMVICDASIATPTPATDWMTLDGVRKAIKAIATVPAVGTPVIHKIFVAS